MCWLIKIGTSTITDSQGFLDETILTSLINNIAYLKKSGIDVMIVSSGAVACGKQIIGDELATDDSFLKLRTQAAIGQPHLINKFTKGFSSHGINISQLLLQDSDFRESDRVNSIKSMLNMLLKNDVIPILNENDATTIRKVDYRDNLGKILWDNDSLAALIAKSVNVERLILVSNIDGVYDNKGDIIDVWEEKYLDKLGVITSSNYGRGGILSKIKAASQAAINGISTYIVNGKTTNILSDLYQGKQIVKTYFPSRPLVKQDKLTNEVMSSEKLNQLIKMAKLGALKNLRNHKLDTRRQWLLKFRDLLVKKSEEIIQANQQDLLVAKTKQVAPALVNRLTISNKTLTSLTNGIDQLVTFPEPIGKRIEHRIIPHPYLQGRNLEWSRHQVPMGLIFVIFESRPDVLVQLLTLAILSGNGMILKGGHEAEQTLKYLFKLFLEAIPISVFSCYNLLFTREEAVIALASPEIDLCIPRGGSNFINWVNKVSIAPVIGHGSGICCGYLHEDVNILDDKVLNLVKHSKLDYRSACNAMEILLVNEIFINDGTLLKAMTFWRSQGIKLLVTSEQSINYPSLSCEISDEICEHGDERLMLWVVKTCQEAINFINKHGSGHTEMIISNDNEIQQQFLSSTNSSCVFSNCSTRCADGYRMGMGCEVGINTNRHSWFRGPVGLEALMTTQIRLQ